MKVLSQLLLALAAVLAIIASVSIFTADYTRNEFGPGLTFRIHEQSYYELHGTQGVILIVVFAILYIAPYLFNRVERLRLTTFSAFLAIAFTYWSGPLLDEPYLGVSYLLSAGSLLLALLFLGIVGILERLRDKVAP